MTLRHSWKSAEIFRLLDAELGLFASHSDSTAYIEPSDMRAESEGI